MGFSGHIYGIPKRQYIYHTCNIKKFSINLGQIFLGTYNFKAPYYVPISKGTFDPYSNFETDSLDF
jgi:hypothetical protein